MSMGKTKQKQKKNITSHITIIGISHYNHIIGISQYITHYNKKYKYNHNN